MKPLSALGAYGGGTFIKKKGKSWDFVCTLAWVLISFFCFLFTMILSYFFVSQLAERAPRNMFYLNCLRITFTCFRNCEFHKREGLLLWPLQGCQNTSTIKKELFKKEMVKMTEMREGWFILSF